MRLDIYKYLSRSGSLALGVVGLANVGKLTFFQAITRTLKGNPGNYPFATIEPEESKIEVSSPRLDRLQQLYQSNKKVPTTLKIFDIAGLTRNASSGEGLGNKFLNDIRQVDGIFQVVRGFRDDEIIHIENSVDPKRDLEIVLDELILKDLEFIEIALEKLQKQLKKPGMTQAVQKEIDLLQQLSDFLYEGKKMSTFEFKDAENVELIRKYNFLTIKPTIYLLNVNEQDLQLQQNEFLPAIQSWIQENCPNDKLRLISATSQSNFDEIVGDMRDSLGLISFFTCGPQEVREWTIKRGTTAQDAAGVIHNDLKKSFILAQVSKYEDVKDMGQASELALRTKGLVQRYGKTKEVEDGDIVLFKSALGSK